jgi:hypothetical protein
VAHPTLCFKVPADLHTAIVEMAERSGVTASEWLRDQMHRIVYGEPLGMEQGYIEGRQLGFRTLQLVFKDAWDDMPETIEDAVAKMQEYSRTRSAG